MIWRRTVLVIDCANSDSDSQRLVAFVDRRSKAPRLSIAIGEREDDASGQLIDDADRAALLLTREEAIALVDWIREEINYQ